MSENQILDDIKTGDIVHLNGIRDDNRIENLIGVTSENIGIVKALRTMDWSSEYHGVYYNPNNKKWGFAIANGTEIVYQ